MRGSNRKKRSAVGAYRANIIGGDVGLIQLVLEAEEIRNELRQSIEKARGEFQVD